MYDNNSKGISYTAGFFILIGFAVAGLLLASFISIPVWTNMTGLPVKDMEAAMKDPANANAVKIIQCINAVVGFLLPAVFTAWLLNRRPMKLIGFSGRINGWQIALVFGIVLAALFVSGFLSYVNERIPISTALRVKFDKMESDYNDQVQAILGLHNGGEYLIALIILAFLPALCEETLFRGGLQNFLTRATKAPWLSIIIVSIIFSVAHFSYFGFLSRFFLGVMLGLLYEYSGRIWLNILAHFLNNAGAITAFYIYKMQGKPLEQTINDRASGYWGFIAIPVFIILMVLFKKASDSRDRDRLFSFEEKPGNSPHGF